MTIKPKMTASILALGTAVAVLSATSLAAAQEIQDVPGSAGPAPGSLGRQLASNWSIDLRATYSDNFRRLQDERGRILFVEPAGLEGLTIPVVVQNEIDPPDNVILSGALRGGTYYRRPGLTGLVQGSVNVSAFADNASLDERLEDTPIPDDALPEGLEGEVVSATFGLEREQDIFIRPNVNAAATARLVEDLVYVDAAAVAQQQTINQRNALANAVPGQFGDVTTFLGGSVSPYLNRQVGGGTLEARYRLSAVIVAAEDFGVDDTLNDPAVGGGPIRNEDQRFANDSIANEAIISYNTGRLFDRVDLTVGASAARSDEDGSDIIDEVELTRLTANADLRYALSSTIAATGSVGYDDVSVDENPAVAGEPDPIDQDSRDGEFSGVFWSAGLEARLSQRSRASLSVGERFGGTRINGQLSLRPTPRISVTGRADRVLQTGTQEGFEGALRINSRSLEIVRQLANIQTGSARDLVERTINFQGGFDNIQQQGFGVSVRNTFGLNASYAARRTDFSAGILFNDSEFGEGDRARENKRYALQASAQRLLSRRASAGVSARFERVEGVLPVEAILEDNPSDLSSDQYLVSVFGSYQVGRNLAVTARAYRAESSGGRGVGIAREYEENAVSAGIRWTF